MADTIQIPNAAQRIALDDGRPSQPWYAILARLGTFFNTLSASLDSTITSLGNKAAKTQDWDEAVFIEFADNKDYKFIDRAFGWTITSVVTICVSGTCTLTGKINTTALGGSANSVSSVEQTQAHSSANVVAAGDDLVLTISANAAATGVSVTLKGTRTLA